MAYNEENIYCPMIDREISPVLCMQHRELREDIIEKAYGSKLKENWKEICNRCKWSEY